MKKLFFVACCLLLVAGSVAQSVSQTLQKTFQQFVSSLQIEKTN